MSENFTGKETVIETENFTDREVVSEVPKSKLKLIALKIITVILYALVTVFTTITFISTVNDGNGLAYAVFLILLLAYGSVAYAVCLIVALIGLFITVSKRKTHDVKGSLIFFIVFSVLPLLTFLIFFISIIIIAKTNPANATSLALMFLSRI